MASDNRAFIETTWTATHEQCRRWYSKNDYDAALSVPNAATLGRYLTEIQRQYSDPLFINKAGEVGQALGVFKQLSDEIKRTMLPQQLDFAIVWGSMKLLLEVRGIRHQACGCFGFSLRSSPRSPTKLALKAL